MMQRVSLTVRSQDQIPYNGIESFQVFHFHLAQTKSQDQIPYNGIERIKIFYPRLYNQLRLKTKFRITELKGSLWEFCEGGACSLVSRPNSV